MELPKVGGEAEFENFGTKEGRGRKPTSAHELIASKGAKKV